MLDAIHRQWQMLRYLPRYPQRIGTKELTARLTQDGYNVSMRTVQRDLQHLSERFPLVCDENRPRGWSFAQEAHGFEIPGLATHEAVALRLAQAFLEPLLPVASRQRLTPHFRTAEEVLAPTTLGRWTKRVAVASSGMRAELPQVEPALADQISEALMAGVEIDARYCRRGEREARAYRLHPLGLVYRDGVGYLLAMHGDYEDVLQLALHRFVVAKASERPARDKDGFDAQAYAQSDAMGYLLSEEPVALELVLDALAGARLVEVPIAADQTVQDLPDGSLRLRATVADTRALRTMLLGFGAHCEVVAPAWLRAEIAQTLGAAAGRYEC